MNQPIVIWFLSVTAVGVLGSVYQDMQRCRTEADHTVVNFHRLGNELIDRRRRLYRAIADASSIEDLRADEVVMGWAKWYVYLEFRDRTIKDIEEQYVRVGKRLAHFPPEVLDMTRERFRRSNEAWDKQDASPLARIDLDRPDFSNLSDADLPVLKDLAEKADRIVLNALFRAASQDIVLACGPWLSLQRVVSGQPDIVGTLQMK